jgi:hypothetical protein
MSIIGDVIQVLSWASMGALPGSRGRYRIFGRFGGGGFFADITMEWQGGDEWHVCVTDTNYPGSFSHLKAACLRAVLYI